MAQGFYGSFEDMLNGYCRHVLLEKISDDDMELKDVLNIIEDLKNEIKNYEVQK